MKVIERFIKFSLHTFGLEILRANSSKCPELPRPSPELVQFTAAAFSDAFPIASQSSLSLNDIEAKLQHYEWFYHFELGGRHVGPHPDAPKDARGHYQRYQHIFPAILSLTGGTLAGNRILDVGCNAGFWSIQAKQVGASNVLGIDSSEANIHQARFVAELIGLNDAKFCVTNTYDVSKETLGEFDITLFFGLLYHLDSPVLALQRMYNVTKKFIVIDTQLTNADIAILKIDDDTADRYHKQSHTNPIALIPSESAVLFMLKSVGFRNVFRIPTLSKNLPEHYLTGRWATFIAYK